MRQGDDGARGLSESVQLSLDRGSLGAKAMPPAVTKAMHAALVDGARDLGVPAALVESEFVRPLVRSVQEAMGVCAVAFGPMGTREQVRVCVCVCVCAMTQVEEPCPESSYFLTPRGERAACRVEAVRLAMGATKAPDCRYGLVQAASHRHDSCDLPQ